MGTTRVDYERENVRHFQDCLLYYRFCRATLNSQVLFHHLDMTIYMQNTNIMITLNLITLWLNHILSYYY